jgi:hypothetical protein
LHVGASSVRNAFRSKSGVVVNIPSRHSHPNNQSKKEREHGEA